MVELLAPAGDWSCMHAAINAGADAVYFGISGMNMREFAKNFTIDDLKEIGKLPVKTYLVVNTITFDEELDKVKEVLQKAKEANISAIICWDLAVLSLAKELDLEVHLSTQASVANSKAIKEYQKLGVNRFILARELNLEQIKKIKQETNAFIETFVHGAMCVAISGRCFMSQEMFKQSANRGKCLQLCRRSYIITDSETGTEFEMNNNRVMSAKDLCALPFLDKLVEAGIDSFKIEGRSKGPEYVDIVVKVYRKALEAIKENNFTEELKEKLMKELEEVYNRGFSSGFYLGSPTADDFTNIHGNKSKTHKVEIGKVINFFKENNVAVIKIMADELNLEDELIILGPTTGIVRTKIESMEIEHKQVDKVSKGQLVGIKLPSLVRENDKVYKWVKE